MAVYVMSVGGSPSACVSDVAVSELASEVHSMSDHPPCQSWHHWYCGLLMKTALSLTFLAQGEIRGS